MVLLVPQVLVLVVLALVTQMVAVVAMQEHKLQQELPLLTQEAVVAVVVAEMAVANRMETVVQAV